MREVGWNALRRAVETMPVTIWLARRPANRPKRCSSKRTAEMRHVEKRPFRDPRLQGRLGAFARQSAGRAAHRRAGRRRMHEAAAAPDGVAWFTVVRGTIGPGHFRPAVSEGPARRADKGRPREGGLILATPGERQFSLTLARESATECDSASSHSTPSGSPAAGRLAFRPPELSRWFAEPYAARSVKGCS